MALLTLSNAHLAYGHVPLLDGADFALEAGERVALIGRNGAGKSSLLKVLAGLERADDGLLQMQTGLRRVYVPQEPAFAPGVSVFDAVAEGVAEARALRARYEAHASRRRGPRRAADALEALGGWTWEQRVDEALQRLNLDGGPRRHLSGGTKKRVALAQALVAARRAAARRAHQPPRHRRHRVAAGPADGLARRAGADLARPRLHRRRGHAHRRARPRPAAQLPRQLRAFEAAKERELEAEALAAARADKLLAQEEVWIRKGVEARRTRSVGRVARLVKLRASACAAARAAGPGAAGARRRPAAGQDRRRAEGRRHALRRRADRPLQRHHPARRQGRPDRPQRLRQDHAAQAHPRRTAAHRGSVRQGSKLQVAYFDQMRAGLRLDATLADTISPGSEWVEIGRPAQARDELPDRLPVLARARQLPVRTLSGGERNRLLLARLFALPANVLVLDEPTNDLDIDTLDLLEELLQGYAGTVFLVSHDRRFLDNVVTSTIAWEGDPAFGGRPGLWREYEGGYEDWKLQRERARGLAQAAAPAPAPAPKPAEPPRPPAARTKLSYKEQRELDALPARIEALEAEQKALNDLLADPVLYAREPQRATELHTPPCGHRRGADGRAGALGGPGQPLSGATCNGSRRQRVLLNQPSLVAAGCVRLTISPACRYRPLSMRMARVRSKPGHSAISRRLVVWRLSFFAGRGQRAREVEDAQVHGRRDAVGRLAGDLGQQFVARAAQRQLPQQLAQRRIVRLHRRLRQRGQVGHGHRGLLDAQHLQVGQLQVEELRHRQHAVHQAVHREDRQRQHVLAQLQVHGDGAGMAHRAGQHLEQLALRPLPSKRSRSWCSEGSSADSRVVMRSSVVSRSSSTWRRKALARMSSAAPIGSVDSKVITGIGPWRRAAVKQRVKWYAGCAQGHALFHLPTSGVIGGGAQAPPEARVLPGGEVHAHQRRRPRPGVEQRARGDQPAFVQQLLRPAVGVAAGVDPAEQALRRRDEAAAGVRTRRTVRPRAASSRVITRSAWRRSSALVQAPGHGVAPAARRGQRAQQLGVDEALGQRRRGRGEVAHAPLRRQDLREARDVDRALQPVELRQPRGMRRRQPGVGVVLDDHRSCASASAAPGAPRPAPASRRWGCAAPTRSRTAAAGARAAARSSPPGRGRRRPRGTGSSRMPRRVRRAYSTAQPGSSTSTASPGCSSVRDTMSSAWVAPTVVTICSASAGMPRSASRRDSACAQRRVAGRVAVAQPGARRAAAIARRSARCSSGRPASPRAACPCRAPAPPRLEHAADQRRGVHRRRGPAACRRPAPRLRSGRLRPAHEEAALRPRLDQALRLQQVVGRHHGAGLTPCAARSRAPRAAARPAPAGAADALGKALRQLLGQRGAGPARSGRVRGLGQGGHRAVWSVAASTDRETVLVSVSLLCCLPPRLRHDDDQPATPAAAVPAPATAAGGDARAAAGGWALGVLIFALTCR
jgi:ABC transport system ATP-binding/permease protein